MVQMLTGDIFDSGADVICHQVNCRGVMGAGLAKQVKEKYPKAYEDYMACAKDINIGYGDMELSWKHMYGKAQVVDCGDTTIVNLFAQDGYGTNPLVQYTSYDAFWNSLCDLNKKLPEDVIIAFPYKIGCGLGKADWDIIYRMIEMFSEDREVEIWRKVND